VSTVQPLDFLIGVPGPRRGKTWSKEATHPPMPRKVTETGVPQAAQQVGAKPGAWWSYLHL
jgi:hypothetical protein